jgi:5,6,7,8-tetrahydromethanopterin hydro-lyase
LIRMPHLLTPRTYLVLAVACLLGLGGGALLVAVDSPGILFYVLGVLLVGLYTLQALKPGVGLRPLRRGTTEPFGRRERVASRTVGIEDSLAGNSAEETKGQPSTEAEPSTGAEPRTLSVGESLVGDGAEVAHIHLLIGSKRGPVGKAFAGALLNQKEGHTNLLAVVAPNLPAKPDTVMVNRVTIKGENQVGHMFGPAQAAVSRGVVDSVRDGVIPEGEVDDLCVIVGVFIHWLAEDEKKIFDWNYQATKEAIARAMADEPALTKWTDNWTVNYGRAGGLLDPTEQLERARRTVRVRVDGEGRGVSTPIEQAAAAPPRTVYA